MSWFTGEGEFAGGGWRSCEVDPERPGGVELDFSGAKERGRRGVLVGVLGRENLGLNGTK